MELPPIAAVAVAVESATVVWPMLPAAGYLPLRPEEEVRAVPRTSYRPQGVATPCLALAIAFAGVAFVGVALVAETFRALFTMAFALALLLDFVGGAVCIRRKLATVCPPREWAGPASCVPGKPQCQP